MGGAPVTIGEDLASDILCHHCSALQVHVHRGNGCPLCTLQLLIGHTLGCRLQSRAPRCGREVYTARPRLQSMLRCTF